LLANKSKTKLKQEITNKKFMKETRSSDCFARHSVKTINDAYTTKELQIPTANTSKIQRLKPENTTRLFSVHPFGEANTTGTPTTKAKDTTIKASRAS